MSASFFRQRAQPPATGSGLTRAVDGLIACLFCLVLLYAQPAWAQEHYADVPGPDGGDILSVSSAAGPPLHSFWVNAHIMQRSDSLESYQSMTFTLLYGMHQRACFGITASHYAHDLGVGPTGLPINKQGPGDTRIFFKWRARQNNDSPIFLGLRPSLRIPTGYDREGQGLFTFTTGTIDFELLGLLAYETPRVGIYLNPGISLPGGKWHNELLGGVGFDVRGGLPLGLSLRGEYKTRFDIPEESFRHVIYGALGHGLLFGLHGEVGMRKQLLHGEEPGPEMTFRIGVGRSQGMPAVLVPPPRSRPVRIVVSPVTSVAPDPSGMTRILRETLVRELSRQPGISACTQGQGDYTASLQLVSVGEATGRGPSIPKLLATPRVTIEITALITLIDSEGKCIIESAPLNLNLKRGTGMIFLPSRGDEDTWVPTAQTRAALRHEGLRRLAESAAKEVASCAIALKEDRS